MNKKGRPSKFTQEIADEICERIVCGESLVKICADKAMPGYTTVMRWCSDNKIFRENYTRARIEQADFEVECIKEVIDKMLIGEIHPLSARVAVDALKWTAGKRNPKKYGDKIEHEVSGDVEVKVTIGGNAKDTP